jgi:hypothetical protein
MTFESEKRNKKEVKLIICLPSTSYLFNFKKIHRKVGKNKITCRDHHREKADDEVALLSQQAVSC